MTTFDKTAEATHRVHAGRRNHRRVETVLDLSDQNLSQNDIIEAIPVYTGDVVERVVLEVQTAEGEAATINVGDGSSATRYHNAQSINSTGYVKGSEANHLYTSDDTIDVAAPDAVTYDVAVIRLSADIVSHHPY